MEALILKGEPVGETDMLVTVLTRDGKKMEGFAKSSRLMESKLRAGTLPCTVSDVTFIAGRRQWHLRSAQPVLVFPAFHQSREALATVVAIGALFAEGATEAEDPGLYMEATRIFRDLHTAASVRESTVTLARRSAAAIMKTLEALGFAPAFDRCVSCGAREPLAAVSAPQGGMVCGPCASQDPESRPLSQSAVTALSHRRVPTATGDVRTMLRFLSAFVSSRLPQAFSPVRNVAFAFLSVSARTA